MSLVLVMIVDNFGVAQQVSTDNRGNYGAVVRAGSVRVDVIESTLPTAHLLTTANDPQTAFVGSGSRTVTSAVGYKPSASAGATMRATPIVVATAASVQGTTPTPSPSAPPTPRPSMLPTSTPTPTPMPTNGAENQGQECRAIDVSGRLGGAGRLCTDTWFSRSHCA